MAYTDYTTVAEFKKWVPQKHLGELSNDTDGEFTEDNANVVESLEWGADMLESQASVRDDIPIPVIDADGNTPSTVKKFIHTLALYWLYERRGHISDQVQESFNVQMTWIADVRSRKANIKLLDANDDEITETTETPIIDGSQKRQFDDFNFG